jgi:hypothetical protein
LSFEDILMLAGMRTPHRPSCEWVCTSQQFESLAREKFRTVYSGLSGTGTWREFFVTMPGMRGRYIGEHCGDTGWNGCRQVMWMRSSPAVA